MLDIDLIEVPRLARRGNTFYQRIEQVLKKPRIPYSNSTSPHILLWGPGGSYQQEVVQAHRAKGGVVFMLDIGYWHREQYAARLTINTFHPPQYLHLGLSRSPRFALQGIPTGSLYNPTGHILLCGTGAKSRAFYGQDRMSWEESTLAYIKDKFPDRQVVYRPKPKTLDPVPEGCQDGSTGSIEHWLWGCAGVYVQHSNVQVDALRWDIPCQMDGGILFGSAFGDRMEKLEAVSWFNWLPDEAEGMLDFLTEHSERGVW